MGRLDLSSREAAARDIRELQKRGMEDSQFWDLHHRRNLRESEGIKAHLQYLAKPFSSLRGDQQQTARRFQACLELLKAGAAWPEAIRRAEELFPGARSKSRS